MHEQKNAQQAAEHQYRLPSPSVGTSNLPGGLRYNKNGGLNVFKTARGLRGPVAKDENTGTEYQLSQYFEDPNVVLARYYKDQIKETT